MSTDQIFALGFDVGGRSFKGVLVDQRGQVLARGTDASTLELEAGLARVREAARRLQEQAGVTAVRLGIAAPGLPSADRRRIATLPGGKVPFEGVDWADGLGWPVVVPVINDAQAALLGEAWTGAAAGRRDVILLTLGTGVGGGILSGGRLLTGARNRAGHLGHICLDPGGRPGIVGMPGTLEDAIGDQTVALRSGGRFTSTRQLIEAYRAGDEDAARVWLAAVHALACGIGSLINVLDPELVVIGGGIAGAGPDLFEPVAAALARVEWRLFGAGVPVVPAVLGEFAGAIGAARLALEPREMS